MGVGVHLVLGLICGLIAAAIAAQKGRSAIGWFFGGAFLGLIGIIVVAVISNKKEERQQRLQGAQERRRLREQLRQERIKGEAFRRHAAARLDVHDQSLGLDTRSAQALPGPSAPAQLTTGAAAAPPPGAKTWYYEVNGETFGPVSPAEITDLLATGRISRSTLLWSEDLVEWTPVSQLPEFRSGGAS